MNLKSKLYRPDIRAMERSHALADVWPDFFSEYETIHMKPSTLRKLTALSYDLQEAICDAHTEACASRSPLADMALHDLIRPAVEIHNRIERVCLSIQDDAKINR